MKKRIANRLLAAFAVATLFVGGAFAQGTTLPGAVGDYTSGATETEFWVTQGEVMPFYAQPDGYYHPDYNPAGADYSLTAGFIWNWSIAAGAAGGLTFSQTGVNDNYVAITAVTVGDYTIEVTEENTNVTPSCPGAATDLDIHVIAAPTAQLNSVLGFDLCGNQPAELITINITENAPAGRASYAFRLVETIETYDFGTSSWTTTATNNIDFGTLAAKLNTLGGAAPNYTTTHTTPALNVVATSRTRYTYTLASATGATGTGIVSGVSHRSNYLDGGTVTAHAFGANTAVAFIVNPAPVTGPIFHIDNDFAF